jgi:hypothetical protein
MSTYQKMNPEVKRVWINELRSGRYKQTDGALRRKGSYCCLGVLCDMSKASKWEATPLGWEHKYGGMAGLPPASVREWAELSRRAQDELSHLNDCGATFAKIADWIERHL